MLSEIDLKDWCIQSPDIKELYNVPSKSLVSAIGREEEPFMFHHVDGMYSYCSLLNGEVFHPAAWTQVLVWSKK